MYSGEFIKDVKSETKMMKITTTVTIAATVGGVAVGGVLRFPLTALIEELYKLGDIDSIVLKRRLRLREVPREGPGYDLRTDSSGVGAERGWVTAVSSVHPAGLCGLLGCRGSQLEPGGKEMQGPSGDPRAWWNCRAGVSPPRRPFLVLSCAQLSMASPHRERGSGSPIPGSVPSSTS